MKTNQLSETALVRVSNRKMLHGFLVAVLADDTKIPAVSTLIDKYEKIGRDNFILSLKDYGILEETSEKILSFLDAKPDANSLQNLKELAQNTEFHTGIDELSELCGYISAIREKLMLNFDYVIDTKIVRGLDYYTGNVFECIIKQEPSIGSVCSGGRYENLTGYIDPKKPYYSGTG